MEMSIEQKRALALAAARARAAEGGDIGAAPDGVESAPGIGENFARGLGQGALDVMETVYKPTSWLQEKFANAVGLPQPDREEVIREAQASRDRFNKGPGATLSGSIGHVTGQIATSIPAMVSGGAVAQGLAKGVPFVEPAVGFLSGGGGLASKSAAGAVQGGTAAALTSAGSDNPTRDIVAGAILGGGLPVAWQGAKAAGRGIGNVIAPTGRMTPEAMDLAKNAADEGISLNAAQLTNNPYLRALDSVTRRVPFSGATSELNAQQSAFNRAVGRRIGVETDKITPDVYAAAKRRLGGEFERLSANNALPITEDIALQIASIGDDAARFASDDTAKAIKSVAEELASKINEGALPGRAYQSLDSKMGQIMKSGGEKSYYIGKVRDALRDAMDNAIAPEDRAAWQTARQQYRNLKTIRDLVVKGGVDGNVNPAQLLGRMTASGSGKEAVASGRAGDLTDLAMIGQRFLKDTIPNSGTPERLAAYSALGGGTMVAPTTTLGVVGSANLARRVMNSDVYRKMLLARAVDGYVSPAAQTVQNPLVQRLVPYGTPAAVLAVTNALRESR